MHTDDLPGEPYTLIILLVFCLLFGILASMVQVYLDADDIEKTNHYYAATRWIHICTGFWFCLCGMRWIPVHPMLSAFLFIYLYVFFALQLPKRIAHQKDYRQLVLKIYNGFHPFFFILTFPVQIKTFFEDHVSEEDIREMIDVGSESGNIKQTQTEMIKNVFEMDDISIEEICTHRSDVICLYLDETPDQWRTLIHDNRHTFYPVCGEDEDDIRGVLDTRDYFRLNDDTNQDNIINKAMDEPFFEAENTKVDHLFREMTSRKNYFSIVLDEYGGMTGICTLHDIMESLVGEIYEENEMDYEDIQRIDQNQWRIYGSAELEEVEEQLGLNLHDQDNDTFNGYILSQYGHIPEDGSQFEVDLDQILITVKDVKNHRIGQTVVQVKNPSKTEK